MAIFLVKAACHFCIQVEERKTRYAAVDDYLLDLAVIFFKNKILRTDAQTISRQVSNMMKRFFPLLLLLALIAFPPLSEAAMKPLPKIRVGIPPTEILKEIIRHEPVPTTATGKKEEERAPLVTWLVDPDERVGPNLLPPSSEGRIFTVTSIAAQLLPERAAVDYGVRELLTPVLLITDDSRGRFIRIFLEGYSDQDNAMRQVLDHLNLPLHDEAMAVVQAKELSEQTFMAAIEKNIDFQVQEALARYRDRITSGRLLVAGGVIDIDNAYGLGANRLIIININGETDPAKMRLMREVATIGRQAADLLGRRFSSTEAGAPAAPDGVAAQPTPAKK